MHPDDDMMYEDDESMYRSRRFSEPGGRSALHPGKRIHPCPNCKRPHQLTERDMRARYQCDSCADRDEGVGP